MEVSGYDFSKVTFSSSTVFGETFNLIKMKKILFPTAYTTHSKVAYRYTQKVAQYFNTGITLVHIYSNPSALPDSELEFVDEVSQQSLMTSDDERWEEELSKLKGFAIEMNAKQFQDISCGNRWKRSSRIT
jgi:hypothetical protein